MDLLRLTLVVVGLVIIAGIYFKFRPDNGGSSHTAINDASADNNLTSDNDDLIPVLNPIDDEPDLNDFEVLSQVISDRERFEEYSRSAEDNFTAAEEDFAESGDASLLIVLNIMSVKESMFTGEDIHAAMTSAGLTHGEHKIYHFMKNGVAVFSIANAIEPGYFDLTTLDNVETPGLAVFMQLPGPVECRQALDTLLDISKQLATTLNGELCDENRNHLSQQTITHLKDKVESYRLQQLKQASLARQ